MILGWISVPFNDPSAKNDKNPQKEEKVGNFITKLEETPHLKLKKNGEIKRGRMEYWGKRENGVCVNLDLERKRERKKLEVKREKRKSH